MAKKSSDTTKEAAAPKKAAPKAAVKKTAVTKVSKPKAEAATKVETPKTATKTSAVKKAPKAATPPPTPTPAPTAKATPAPAPKKAAPKKAAGPKLNERQIDFLKKIKDAGEAGYAIGQKIEQRTIDALSTQKLLKRSAKNKETGKHHYQLTKLGEKQLGTDGSAKTTA